MALFTESTLSDSYIYSMFDNNKVVSSKIASMLKNPKTIIQPEVIEAQLLQIKQTRISPMWEEVIDAFNKKDIVLLYDKSIGIPPSVPFVVIKSGSGMKAIVILNRIGAFNKMEDMFNINFKDLYVLMETAYVAKRYYERPQLISRNSGLMKLCTQIYTEMTRRVLSRDYSLVTDEVLQSQVLYTVSRFFIERVWSTESPNAAHNYAVTISAISAVDATLIKQQYESEDILTVDKMLEFLSGLNSRLRNLQKKAYIERWINTYGVGAILGMDCLPYFLYIISCTLIGSFLINQPTMSDICKNSRGINSSIYYPELSRSMI